MGRILKKVLVGSGLAIAIFLITIFLFGDSNTVSVTSSENDGSNFRIAASEKLSVNLTQTMTEELALKLLNDNPQGPTISEDGTPLISLDDPDAFIAKALAAETDQISFDDFIADIDETHILVNKTPTDQDRTSYLALFLDAVKTHLKTTLDGNNDPQKLMGSLVRERQALIGSLYKLTVPNDFLEIHQEFLTILGTQINIFSALAKYQEDPLKALLAARFQKEIAQNLLSLQGRIVEYLKIHNLDA